MADIHLGKYHINKSQKHQESISPGLQEEYPFIKDVVHRTDNIHSSDSLSI